MLHRDAFSSDLIHSWRCMDGHRHRREIRSNSVRQSAFFDLCTEKAPVTVLHMRRLQWAAPGDLEAVHVPGLQKTPLTIYVQENKPSCDRCERA